VHENGPTFQRTGSAFHKSLGPDLAGGLAFAVLSTSDLAGGLAFAVFSTSAAMRVVDKADAPEAAGAPNHGIPEHVFVSFLLSPHCPFSPPLFESRLDEDWLDEGLQRSCSVTASTVLVCIIMSIIVSLFSSIALLSFLTLKGRNFTFTYFTTH